MLTLDATSKIDAAGPPAGEKVAGEGPPAGAASRWNRKLRRSAGGGAGEQVQQAWGATTGTKSRGGAFSSSIWSPGRGTRSRGGAFSSSIWSPGRRPGPLLGRERRDPLGRSGGGGGGGAQHETGRGEIFCYILVAKAGNFIEVSWGGL